MESKDLNQLQQEEGRKAHRFLPRSLAAAAMAGSMLLMAPVAFSAVITVGGDTGCTLPDAIDAANADANTGTCTDAPDGAVVGAYGADTIELSDNVALDAPLSNVLSEIVIDGMGNEISRNDGAPGFRILRVGAAGKLEVKNTTITGGLLDGASGKGAGIRCIAAATSLTLDNTTVTNNMATGVTADGGGIHTACNTIIKNGSSINDNMAGQDGGGIYVSSATTGDLSIDDSAVSSNTALFGAGVQANAGMVTISNSRITSNMATGDAGGGAYFLGTGDITITRSDINNNSAKVAGGGIGADADGGAVATVTIQHSAINNNTAAGDGPGGEEGAFGGGIYAADHIVLISNTSIRGNKATDDDLVSQETSGGGVSLFDVDPTSRIDNSIISNNQASFLGGGVGMRDTGGFTLDNNTISGNSAELGGGVVAINSTFGMDLSNVSGNTASEAGGGIFAAAGSMILIEHSNIADNVAENSSGGGLHATATDPFGLADAASTVTSNNNTYSGNTASLNGAGIFNEASTVTLNINTLSGNVTDTTGGGAMHSISTALGNSTTTVLDSTFANNQSTSGGGAFDQTEDAMTATTDINGSLLSGNTGGNCNAAVEGTVLLGSQSNISTDGTCDNAANDNQGITANVNLGALADNGGPTLTHELPSNSTAVDTGDAIALLDQIDNTRPFNSPDVPGNGSDTGAREYTGMRLGIVDNNAVSLNVAVDKDEVILMDVAVTAVGGAATLGTLDGTFCAPGHVADVEQFTVIDDVNKNGILDGGDVTLSTKLNPTDEEAFSLSGGGLNILENETKNLLILANFDDTLDMAVAPSSTWTQSAMAGPLTQSAILSSNAARIAMLLAGLLLVAGFVFEGAALRRIRMTLLIAFMGVAITACGSDSDGDDNDIGGTPSVVVGENGIASAAALINSYCMRLENIGTTGEFPAAGLPIVGSTIKVID